METMEQQIAQWMVSQIEHNGMMHQSDVIAHVKANFGEQYVFVNENGNESLSKRSKKHFGSSIEVELLGTGTVFSGRGLNRLVREKRWSARSCSTFFC